MNYRDLTTPSQPSRPDADFQAIAQRILGESYGLIDDARRQQTPHFIDVKGLSRKPHPHTKRNLFIGSLSVIQPLALEQKRNKMSV